MVRFFKEARHAGAANFMRDGLVPTVMTRMGPTVEWDMPHSLVQLEEEGRRVQSGASRLGIGQIY